MKLTCFRISNGALAAQELPSRLQVLRWGDNPAIRNLVLRLGAHTVSTFAARMQSNGLDKIAIDFEHNTVRGTPAHAETPEPRKVAGYGTPSLVPGDGLYIDEIAWTPCGRENALNYVDLSPAVHIDKRTGEVDLLHSVALTRAGALENVEFFSVDAQGDGNMDWKVFIANLLGLPAETSDEELQAKFKEVYGVNKEEIVAASREAVQADVTPLSAEIQTLRGDVDALKADGVRRDREAIVAQASRDGKVIPLSAEQIAATEPSLLRDMIGKLPVTVPLARRTPEHIAALSADAISPELEAVARRCGMDPKKVMEANKRS